MSQDSESTPADLALSVVAATPEERAAAQSAHGWSLKLRKEEDALEDVSRSSIEK